MADEVNFVPQIDYTSRDYLSIREDLLNLIPLYAPNWTNRDPSDFGITLVELFSYLGDLLNFQVDRAANEGFLATASQRESVLQIAGMLNYRPTSVTPARVELTFTNSSGSEATIPAGTQLATTTIVDGASTQIIFETDAEVTVPAKVGVVNGTVTAEATQGYTVSNEELGISTGAANQIFKLSQGPVVVDSIKVFVNGIQYLLSPYLIDNTIYDPVFTTLTDADGYTYILFGDGVGGRIPPTAGSITATYRVGAGKAGNVPAGKITFFLTNQTSGVTVLNQEEAFGGADEESTDSIRVNAPLALRSLNRAVSLKDYANLALQVPGVAKSVADAEIYTSVNLYIAPFGETGLSLTGTSQVFDDLAARVAEFFVDKTAPNVTLTVLPPTYVPVDIDVTVNVLPQYRQDTVTNQALAALRELFSIDNTFFADRVPVQFVLSVLSQIPGIDYSNVTLLRKTASQQTAKVSAWSRTSNIVTLTTAATHTITAGQTILLEGMPSGLDGTHVVSSVGSTSISFGNVGGDVSSTPVSPNADVKVLAVETIVCAVNEIPREGTFNITAVGGIV